jgi:hypothetical protein
MNNEPVAWIGKPELQFGFTDTRVTNEKESWDDIPLYTHPVKELTDEEIKDFIATFPIIFTPDDLVIFARAILRKAQEK